MRFSIVEVQKKLVLPGKVVVKGNQQETRVNQLPNQSQILVHPDLHRKAHQVEVQKKLILPGKVVVKDSNQDLLIVKEIKKEIDDENYNFISWC